MLRYSRKNIKEQPSICWTCPDTLSPFTLVYQFISTSEIRIYSVETEIMKCLIFFFLCCGTALESKVDDWAQIPEHTYRAFTFWKLGREVPRVKLGVWPRLGRYFVSIPRNSHYCLYSALIFCGSGLVSGLPHTWKDSFAISLFTVNLK